MSTETFEPSRVTRLGELSTVLADYVIAEEECPPELSQEFSELLQGTGHDYTEEEALYEAVNRRRKELQGA